MLWLVHGKFKIGPLYRVINMAPPTVTTVPINFAWLGSFLMLTFSSLQNRNRKSYFRFVEVNKLDSVIHALVV